VTTRGAFLLEQAVLHIYSNVNHYTPSPVLEEECGDSHWSRYEEPLARKETLRE
jgi:hypothetical protein